MGVKGGKSVCQTYSKCQKWGKVADVSQGEHKCGEAQCLTRRKYDNPETHRCFMMPVKKKTKRKRRESDNDEEEEKKNEVSVL